MSRRRYNRAVWGTTLAFVTGFGCCAVLARLLLPMPVAALSSVPLKGLNPADVVASVGDSVVSLEVYPTGAALSNASWPRLLGLSPSEPPVEPDAVASGVIVSKDGYIVTNNHVVEDGGQVRARLADGRDFPASVIGRDPHSDLAVVKIPGRSLKSARIGDSEHLRPGEPVLAIGNPLGFENSVSLGVVSANRRGPFRVDGHTMGDMIQTDAAINQGNSGGGLFTSSGSLVGINSAILVPRGAGGSIGIGFAIPTHRVQSIAHALIANGRVPRPWLGIRYQPPTVAPFIRRVRQGVGVLVDEVLPGSPASRAGMQSADILRQLGDCRIVSPDDIYTFVGRYHPGEKVKARVLRGGSEKTLTLTLAEQPAER
jgi:S1-C subfamily serine protease